MDDHSRSSGTYNQLRVRFSQSWWMPILFGILIALFLGGLVIAVIVLDQKGLIPMWVFGWIARDRATQRRQFLLALCSLLGLWLTTQLVRFGVFGEGASATYKRKLSQFPIRREEEEKLHAGICALNHLWTAVFFVAFFTWEGILSWRALGKPFVEHNLYDLLFRILLTIVYLPVMFKIFRCVPERFIVGIITIRLVTDWVFEFAPNFVEPAAGLIRQFDLILSIVAFLASLAVLVSSFSSRLSAQQP
jgi:hypothetical protein